MIENESIISDDQTIAQTFSDYFKKAVSSLEIPKNILLMSDVMHKDSPVDVAIEKFRYHPSVLQIQNNVICSEKFNFQKISESEIIHQIGNLSTNKANTFLGIPTKLLKKVSAIVAPLLCQIWNVQVIEQHKISSELKNADIKPVHKKLEHIFKKNYRPVSILGVISKVFERIMQQQMNVFVNEILSPSLCGYRKGYSPQYALLAMIEKLKTALDHKKFAGCVMMDLSKAFDTINHDLLIAKLNAYGFSNEALKIMNSYLSDRLQRVKINTSFSSWEKLLTGVPQGSILGPILFNIYINDLFYLFQHTGVCNIADDTTPYACDETLQGLLFRLENDTLIAIEWFHSNFMKLNEDKCHFLFPGNVTQLHSLKVGKERIWESKSEVLLGLTIDKNLTFKDHVQRISLKANQKVSALGRLIHILPHHKKRILMKSFVESQFNYLPLIWMFCSRQQNHKINRIHERALRIVYDDYISSFESLLYRDRTMCVHHKNIHAVAIEMFKIKNNLAPDVLKNLVQNSQRDTRKIFTQREKRTVRYGDNSFASFGPVVWDDMLPEKLKTATTIFEFKKALKKWTPKNCPCKLCKPFIKGVGFVDVIE